MSLIGKQPMAGGQIRQSIQGLPQSAIREIANASMGRDDVLPFWFGESDLPTPAFIREAAKAALDAGHTFYGPNLGLESLREALAVYASGLHGSVGRERIVVTSSGLSALMLAGQLLIDPGDRVVLVTPAWPNVPAISRLLGAAVQEVPLTLEEGPAGANWQLDTDNLLQALTPQTRVLIVNSPSNPTGWVMPVEQQRLVLEHCRQRGIWIISDEVYERLVFTAEGEGGGPTVAKSAPSFLDISEENDLLVVVNSFSKAWLMTGWRLGWLTVPPSVTPQLGKLIEFNTSCVPGFIQQAGLAAVQRGEPVIGEFVQRLRSARDLLHGALIGLPGVTAPLPTAGMYVFFRIQGMTDSLAFCKGLVREVGLGLAPGGAFSKAGEGCLRWCFAGAPERLQEGVERLRRLL